MAALSAQMINMAGLAPTYAAAGAGGDTVPVSDENRTFIHVKNGSGGSINVTFDDIATQTPAGTPGGSFNPDAVIAVPASGERLIGPLDPARFRSSGGTASISYSAVTTVTVACFQLPG